MDKTLYHTVRDITARRDDRLRDPSTIPPHRLEALRATVAQTHAATAPTHARLRPWLASFRESLSPRLCIAAAAACLLVLAAFLRTTTPSAPDGAVMPNAVATLAQAPTTAFDRADAPALTLRIRSADLLQIETEFLPRIAAWQNRGSDDLNPIAFDVSLDTAVDRLQ